ncbi:hypothetical protein ACIBSW_34495 [Actinoplanes sp. NPDC049668]|uniref:hypothetical protein n=1 Tax=unclassified Actinoplanes TaxID=2626549 RepID=UPI0033B4B53F
MTAFDLVAQIVTALFAGGGMWLAVREIAKQVGETKRARIREQGQTERLTIAHVMPLPMGESRPIGKKTEKPRRIDAA